MKTKCYSVRLESLRRISDKCFAARSFDGREALIPASQVFGPDHEVLKSEAWWISAWILERKDIQYSTKKVAYFDRATGLQLPGVEVVRHVPHHIQAQSITPDPSLQR
jgi:hypothetical protein